MSTREAAVPDESPLLQTSQLVRQLRAAVGDTQQQFAHRIDSAISSVVRYEAGKPLSEQAFVKLVRLAREIGRQDIATGLADNYWSLHDPDSHTVPTWQKIVFSIFEKFSPSGPDPEELHFLLQQTTTHRRTDDAIKRIGEEAKLFLGALDDLEKLGDFIEILRHRLLDLRNRLASESGPPEAIQELSEIIAEIEKRLEELEGPEEESTN